MIDELLYWLLASIDELIDDSSITKKEEYKNDDICREGFATVVDDIREFGRHDEG